MLNVGVVGFGFAGKVFHTPVLRAVPGLRLTTIVQRHGAPDPRYPDVDFVPSVDELLSRPLDLIVVATPNTSHIRSPNSASRQGGTSSSTSRLPQPSQRPESSWSSR